VNVAVVPADDTVPPTTPFGSLRLNVVLDSEAPFMASAKFAFTVVTGLTFTAALAGLVETTARAEVACGVTETGSAPGLSPAVVLPPHPARIPIRRRCARPHRAAGGRGRWVSERMT
jgi:hypothetical protein